MPGTSTTALSNGCDPDRSPAGYRDYGPEVLDRLHFIRRGQAAGLTLAQIGQVLAIRTVANPEKLRHLGPISRAWHERWGQQEDES